MSADIALKQNENIKASMNYILTDPQVVADIVAEPVSMTEAKAWMKIAFADDDTLITELCTSSRAILEKFTGLSLGTKQLKVVMQINHPGCLIELPYGPVTAIESVVLDQAFATDDTQTVNVDYEVVGSRLLRVNQCGTFVIVYTAGFTQLPIDLKTDLYRLISWQYRNRGIQFEAQNDVTQFEEWQSLAANRYVKTLI